MSKEEEVDAGQLVKLDQLVRTDSGLTVAQIQKFFTKTPASKIKERPAKGGGTWKYVEGSYVTQVLNSLFGFNWSFEVVTPMGEALNSAKTGSVTVQGRLKVKIGEEWVVKEQFGTKEIAFKNEPVLGEGGSPVYETNKYGKRVPKMQKTNIPLNFGNDMKAAATDAKKKCAAELGLFADVYSQDNFFEATIIEPSEGTDEEKEQAKKEAQETIDAEK